jgi:hypothetical protein
VLKGAVNSRFSGKTKEANEAREELIKANAIKLQEDGKRLTLTDTGKQTLIAGLAQGFKFKAQIGALMANALLELMRSQETSRTLVAKSEVEAIESYEAFKGVVLEVFDRLNRDSKFDNLVPIYRIRQEIGERLSRGNFDAWFLELQANDAVQLIGGEMPELTPAIAQDSIKTALGSVRYYVKYI